MCLSKFYMKTLSFETAYKQYLAPFRASSHSVIRHVVFKKRTKQIVKLNTISSTI